MFIHVTKENVVHNNLTIYCSSHSSRELRHEAVVQLANVSDRSAEEGPRAERDLVHGHLLDPARGGSQEARGRKGQVAGADEASQDDLLARPSDATPYP